MTTAKQLQLKNFLFEVRGWKRWTVKRLKEYNELKELLK